MADEYMKVLIGQAGTSFYTYVTVQLNDYTDVYLAYAVQGFSTNMSVSIKQITSSTTYQITGGSLGSGGMLVLYRSTSTTPLPTTGEYFYYSEPLAFCLSGWTSVSPSKTSTTGWLAGFDPINGYIAPDSIGSSASITLSISDPLPSSYTLTNESPATLTLNGTETLASGGTYTVASDLMIDAAQLTAKATIANGLNLTKATYGSTTYNSFPASLSWTVTGNETTPTFTVYGKEDPEITVNYTNTNTPTISDT